MTNSTQERIAAPAASTAVAATLVPAEPARALFGVGDVVFDPGELRPAPAHLGAARGAARPTATTGAAHGNDAAGLGLQPRRRDARPDAGDPRHARPNCRQPRLTRRPVPRDVGRPRPDDEHHPGSAAVAARPPHAQRAGGRTACPGRRLDGVDAGPGRRRTSPRATPRRGSLPPSRRRTNYWRCRSNSCRSFRRWR